MKKLTFLPLLFLIACASTPQKEIMTHKSLDDRFEIVKPKQNLNGYSFAVSEYTDVPQIKMQNCRKSSSGKNWSDMLASNKYASKSYQHELVEHPEKNKVVSIYGKEYQVMKVIVDNKTDDLLSLKDAVPVLISPDHQIIAALRKEDSIKLMSDEFVCPSFGVKEMIENKLKEMVSYREQSIMPGKQKEIYLIFKLDQKIKKGLWKLSIFNLPHGKSFSTKLVTK